MARAVRKVSRVSTKNQKKEGLNKKLIAIISAIVVVLLGVAVGLIVYFTTQEEEYVSEKVYFVEETYGTNQEAGSVTFVKENYYNIVRQIENEKINEHVFIFAYDGSAFFADSEDEENYELYGKDYETLITRVADLQLAVNAANKEKGIDVVLYIVDVNVDNGVNAALMTDAANLHEDGFSAFYSSADESTVFEPAFFYLHEGEVKKNIDAESKKLVSTNKMSTIMSTSIKNSINFLKSL